MAEPDSAKTIDLQVEDWAPLAEGIMQYIFMHGVGKHIIFLLQ